MTIRGTVRRTLRRRERDEQLHPLAALGLVVWLGATSYAIFTSLGAEVVESEA